MTSPVLRTKLQVRYGDLDTLGHVNNAVYLTYFELGRVLFFRKHLKAFDEKKVSFVIARIEIDFKKSITMDQDVYLETSIESVGNTSFTFAHRIIDEGGPQIYSTGKVIAVSIDGERRPVRVPEELRNLSTQ